MSFQFLNFFIGGRSPNEKQLLTQAQCVMRESEKRNKEKRERAFCYLDVLLRMLIAGLERVLLINQHNEEGQEEALESHY